MNKINQASSYCSEYILSARDIYKTFEDGKKYVEVLKGVDIKVKPAEMVAIVGTSGSGKSTLLHILGGLDSPDKGLVMVAGQDIHQLNIKEQGDLRNKHLGFVYQFHHLLSEFTALENVTIPLIIAGLSEQKARHRAQQIIAKVGLADRARHNPSELSGGERQRIAIARAMVTKPSCILADEPTGNLDRKTAESINQLMFELNRDEETSFLIVSHDLQLAQQMQKRYHLDNGILVQAE